MVEFSLDHNVPNPFNPSTEIHYALPVATPVTIRIYDVRGRLVRELVDAPTMGPGRFVTLWDGRNEHGRGVGSGVYFGHLEAKDFSATHRMVLLK